MTFDPAEHPHRRRNPLNGDWVLVSPHRAKRPWLGQQEEAAEDQAPSYEPHCYLCPGNLRATGERNPAYRGPFVFDNDFAALVAEGPVPMRAAARAPGAGGAGGADGAAGGAGGAGSAGDADGRGGVDGVDGVDGVGSVAGASGLFEVGSAHGVSRVVCFSADHARTLPELTAAEVRAVIDTWCAQSAELAARWRWVQVFENKGAAMGCSNPHPHGQVWASDFLPTEPAAEDREQQAWFARHGRALLLAVAEREAALGTRVVVQSEHWLAIVPFWATWPFETLLLPRFPVQHLQALGPVARDELADVLRELTARYDNLFQCAFPYSMGWHGAPNVLVTHDSASAGSGGSAHITASAAASIPAIAAADAAEDRARAAGTPEHSAHWQLHAHFYPPLLRSATVRKFMVGYEMLAEAQRDLTPEQAAERLRAVPAHHYRQGVGA